MNDVYIPTVSYDKAAINTNVKQTRGENMVSNNDIAQTRILHLLNEVAQLAQTDNVYYQRIPFMPGKLFLSLIPIVQSNASQTIIKLRVHIPDTLLVDGNVKRRIRYSSHEDAIVEVELTTDWEVRLFKRWNACGRTNFPKASDPALAILRTEKYSERLSMMTKDIRGKELNNLLSDPPSKCVVQAFTKSKGNKPSTYRVIWKRGNPPLVFNVISKHSYEASHSIFDDDTNNHISLCPTSADGKEISIFRIKSSVAEHLSDTVAQVIHHLKTSLSRLYSLFTLNFDEMVCDFIRTYENTWTLISIKAFALSNQSYTEACRVSAQIAHKRQVQGKSLHVF